MRLLRLLRMLAMTENGGGCNTLRGYPPQQIPEDIDIFVVVDGLSGIRNVSLRQLKNIPNLKFLIASPAMRFLPILRLKKNFVDIPLCFPRRGFENLRRLELHLSRHWGLRGLRRLNNLQELILYGEGVRDRDLRHLKSLQNLKYLEISETDVSPQAIRELQQELPDCHIYYAPGREYFKEWKK